MISSRCSSNECLPSRCGPKKHSNGSETHSRRPRPNSSRHSLDLVETAVEDREQDDATAGKHLREILEKRGGQEQLLEQCQQVAASLTDEYQPLMWSLLQKPSQSALPAGAFPSHPFDDAGSIAHYRTELHSRAGKSPQSLCTDTLDLSFTSEVWQHLIRVKRKKRTKLAATASGSLHLCSRRRRIQSG